MSKKYMGSFVHIHRVSKDLPTVIAFSSVNTPKNKFKPFKILTDAQINIIFINDNGNRWYQAGVEGIKNNTKRDAIYLVEVARNIGNGKVITFGTSMGAYGAALFAVMGGADGCLLFGVESRLLMKHSRSSQFLKAGTEIKYKSLETLLSSSTIPIWLFCSASDEIDLISAFLLLKSGINIVPIYGVEHPGIQFFDLLDTKVSGLIEEFANNLIVSNTWLDRCSDILQNSNKDLVPELYEIFCLKMDKLYDKCLEKLLALNVLYPDNAIVLLKLGEIYQKLGRIDDASSSWLKAISINKFQSESHAKLAANLRKSQLYNPALDHINKALFLNPYCAHSNNLAGIIHNDLGDYIQAEKFMRIALKINKGNASFRRSLFEFLKADIQRKEKELSVYASMG